VVGTFCRLIFGVPTSALKLHSEDTRQRICARKDEKIKSREERIIHQSQQLIVVEYEKEEEEVCNIIVQHYPKKILTFPINVSPKKKKKLQTTTQ
jgi:hypothetical protein